MKNYPEFARLLNKHLRAQDRPIMWLANKLRLHPSTVTHWLNETTRPGSPKIIEQIVQILGIDNPKEQQDFFAAAGYIYREKSTEASQHTDSIHNLDFGDLLNSALHVQARSIASLAKVTDIPYDTLKNWLNGSVRKPRNLDQILKVARALEVDAINTDRLLQAAGHPSLHEVYENAQSNQQLGIIELLEQWKDSKPQDSRRPIPTCGFCGKNENQVKRLIRGNEGVNICDECTARSIETLAQEGIKSRIVRSIEFTPEHYQAGISILNYFGTVLREKHADLKAKVRIEQEDLKVTLIVESSSGEQEKIERALNEFGLVIQGQMTAEEFLGDQLKALELKQHLRMAQLQLEHQRELHQLSQRQYDNRVKSLEEQVTSLNMHIGNILHYSKNSAALLNVNHINTEGGTYVQGNASTRDGNFIGRDNNKK